LADLLIKERAAVIFSRIKSMGLNRFEYHLADIKAIIKDHYATDFTDSLGLMIDITHAREQSDKLPAYKIGQTESAWKKLLEDLEHKLLTLLKESKTFCALHCEFCKPKRSALEATEEGVKGMYSRYERFPSKSTLGVSPTHYHKSTAIGYVPPLYVQPNESDESMVRSWECEYMGKNDYY